MPDIRSADDNPFIRSLREPGVRPPSRHRQPRNKWLVIAFLALFAIVVALPASATQLADWLWFQEIGFERVFMTKIVAQWIIALAAGLLAFAFFYGNARHALKGMTADVQPVREAVPDARRLQAALGATLGRIVQVLAMPWSGFLALLAGLTMAAQWNTALQAIHATPFGQVDHVFGRDIGYYVFTLPAIEAGVAFVFGVVLVALLFIALPIHLLRAELTAGQPLVIRAHPQRHIAVLAGLLLLVMAIRTYFVTVPGVLFGQHLPLSGANYVDLHVRLPALYLLSVAGLLGAAAIAWGGMRGRLVFVAVRVVVAYAVLAFLTNVIPAAYQRLIVQANELARETPQIARHIEATRRAWGLDSIEQRELTVTTALTPQAIAANRSTIDNVRLWDREPLLQTFGQIQSIRTYYDFVAVDDDRYVIGNQLRQVMLSARELNTEALPTRGFINEHLTYTHGMGVTLGPSNAVTAEGLPVLFVKDLPPASSIEMKITRPQIYFGEQSNEFVLAPTAQREFDYPAGEGDAAVYSAYAGKGGVPVASFGRRLLYAIRFGSINILLSRDLTDQTRIFYNRSIRERVQRALPFVWFDRDPYMVVAADGTLKWLIDGYTTTDRYPYSQPASDGVNYMRNTVKVVVDAYDGDLRAYIAAPDDPIIRTLARIYPGLFQPMSAMPSDLRAHIRYPEDLFRLQTSLFATYHMSNPETFYHREDQWQVPGSAPVDQSVVATRRVRGLRSTIGNVASEPFLRHMVMRLPGEAQAEFILMRPFTPRQKDNLAAWIVARNDGPHYGKLVVYRFPRQSLVFGPNQIANRINQEPEISRQISLWDQRGSEVLRGELLVLPIEGSLIYVQPLYLRAEGGRIPELKRVIVAQEGRVAMAETLDAALVELFGEGSGSTVATTKDGAVVAAPVAVTSRDTVGNTVNADLSRQALQHLERARAAQRADDWATYGAEMKKLEEALRQLAGRRKP